MTAKNLRYYREKYVRHLPTRFCPGCGNGIVLNAFVRALDDLGIPQERVLCVSGIGCSAWIPNPYFSGDSLHTTHGRALAFATGAKVYNRNLKTVVFTGDGDGAGIGGNHLIHAARRNIEITTILVNNMNYGMTGGQTAPTTLYGGLTTTTPYGNPENPFNLTDLVAAAGATYVARWSTYHVIELTKSIEEALQNEGFSFIEVLSQCPTQQRRMFGLSGTSFEIPQRILEMFLESTFIRGQPLKNDYLYAIPKTTPEALFKSIEMKLSGFNPKLKIVDHMAFGRVIRINTERVEEMKRSLEDLDEIESIADPLEEKIELGVFVKCERPEFVKTLHNIIERVGKKNHGV